MCACVSNRKKLNFFSLQLWIMMCGSIKNGTGCVVFLCKLEWIPMILRMVLFRRSTFVCQSNEWEYNYVNLYLHTTLKSGFPIQCAVFNRTKFWRPNPSRSLNNLFAIFVFFFTCRTFTKYTRKYINYTQHKWYCIWEQLEQHCLRGQCNI